MTDEIVFDYDERPLGTETLDYLAAMIREVEQRAAQVGISDARFEFRMIPDMWDAISALYTCTAPDSNADIPIELRRKRAKLKAKQSIFVDGVEYPVKLDRKYENEIFFTHPIRENPLSNFLTAVLQKVGLR